MNESCGLAHGQDELAKAIFCLLELGRCSSGGSSRGDGSLRDSNKRRLPLQDRSNTEPVATEEDDIPSPSIGARLAAAAIEASRRHIYDTDTDESGSEDDSSSGDNENEDGPDLILPSNTARRSVTFADDTDEEEAGDEGTQQEEEETVVNLRCMKATKSMFQ